MDSGISTVQEYIGVQENPNNRNYESSAMEQSS